MKTTVELPDDLVTEIKVEAARRHRKLKDLVPELLRNGLEVQRASVEPTTAEGRVWIDEWVALGRAATRGRPAGPTATEILTRDRDRL